MAITDPMSRPDSLGRTGFEAAELLGEHRGGRGCRNGVVGVDQLEVARLLQSLLGAIAPPGQRGDMVRVSDGSAKAYLGHRTPGRPG
jgi:hypothetical protein